MVMNDNIELHGNAGIYLQDGNVISFQIGDIPAAAPVLEASASSLPSVAAPSSSPTTTSGSPYKATKSLPVDGTTPSATKSSPR